MKTTPTTFYEFTTPPAGNGWGGGPPGEKVRIRVADAPRYMTLKQAAIYLQESESVLYEHGASLYGAVKMGGRWKFDRLEIDRRIKAKRDHYDSLHRQKTEGRPVRRRAESEEGTEKRPPPGKYGYDLSGDPIDKPVFFKDRPEYSKKVAEKR